MNFARRYTTKPEFPNNGGLVVARVEDGELRLRPVKAVLADIQAEVSGRLAGSGETVDRFLAGRRR